MRRRSDHDRRGASWLAYVALAVLGTAPAAAAETDFYSGKTIQMLIGFSAGGGYDIYARTLARHMGRHIPGNPRLIAQNMPGAGSLKAVNYLYDAAPKDGTVIARFAPGVVVEPLDGRCGWSWTSLLSRSKALLDGKQIDVTLQIGLQKDKALLDVPLIMDLTDDPQQKAALRLIVSRQSIARPFAAPPGIPQERARILRQAFDATMRDPEFPNEAKTL